MSDKYEFTDEAHPTDPTLRRIRALIDLPMWGVRAGDRGGWLSGEQNLSHRGQCWVGGDAIVCEYAYVSADAAVTDTAILRGEARATGSARVARRAVLDTHATVHGQGYVYGTAHVTGHATVTGTVRGTAYVGGTAHVPRSVRVDSGGCVTDPSHCLLVQGLPSGTATAVRQRDGSVYLTVGCWSGWPDDLRDLIAGTDWPEAHTDEMRDHRRPGLAALADLAEATVGATPSSAYPA